MADRQLIVPTDKGANPGLKVASMVAGMVAGGGQHRRSGAVAARRDGSAVHQRVSPFHFGLVPASVQVRSCAPTRCGRVRFLAGLASRAPLFPVEVETIGTPSGWAMLDIEDTGVHGYAKQGAGFGYNDPEA